MSHRRLQSSRGFTLLELVVVLVIVGVLAAIAVPRFLNLGTAARIATLKTLEGALRTTAYNVHALCSLNPACSYGNSAQQVTIGGTTVQVNYGWPDSGDNLGSVEIDVLVEHSGFTLSVPSGGQAGDRTVFALDGAPDPLNCSVTYYDAYWRGGSINIATLTSGC